MIIDLCCGLGKWPTDDEVISVDTNPKVKPTIVGDVRYLPLRKGIKPRLVHASPPCRFFSYARLRSIESYDERGIAESLRIVAACFDAFKWLEADTWTLENPQGVLRKIIRPNASTEWAAFEFTNKKTDFWSNNRGLKRALIPKDVKQRLLELSDL